MCDTVPEDRVNEALRRALAGRVVHPDQTSQYTATRFKNLLARGSA